MKDGTCPMCKSNEVYMTEKNTNLDIGDGRGLSFDADGGPRVSGIYYFDTYVCVSCGYTAMFAKAARADFPGLSLLKNAKGWKKAG
jgi:hypothetical protein